jgi:hypothetical protein
LCTALGQRPSGRRPNPRERPPHSPPQRKWYEPVDGRPGGEPFPAKLDAALEERGSAARCWAHCEKGHQIFHWSGDNSWIARTNAASALCDYVAKLRKEGWRCHIVAHSHGGNIVADALPLIMAASSLNESLGKIITLGTPFMDAMSPILERAKRTQRRLDVTSWIGFVIVTAAFTAGAYLLGGIPLAILAFLLLIALPVFRWFRTRGIRPGDLQGPDQRQPSFLAIGSPKDEPWQILNHIRTLQNPLAPRSNLVSYVFSSLRSHILRNAQIARIHGAKSYRDLGRVAKIFMALIYAVTILAVLSMFFGLVEMLISPDVAPEFWKRIMWAFFSIPVVILFLSPVILAVVLFFAKFLAEISFYSAYLAPFRWFTQRASSLGGIFTETATYVVLIRGWSVLQEIVMGLEGYRFAMPCIDRQFPRNVPEKLVKYEDIPKGAEDRAIKQRSAWIDRHLPDISNTFSKALVTVPEIMSLLRTIEEDQTLIHAAYYIDDECIARIADWIAGINDLSELTARPLRPATATAASR